MTSDPVVALTYFYGVVTPMVEIWTPMPKHAGCVEPACSYGYTRLNQPPCETDEEWFAWLRRSERTVFLKAAPRAEGDLPTNASTALFIAPGLERQVPRES